MIRVVEARIFIAQEGTFWVSTLKRSAGSSRTIRIGAPDPTLTGSAGLLAVAELADRLGLIKELDAAAGTGFKQRRRGCSAGEFLTAMACAQLTGADHLVGLDHRRADAVTEAFWSHATPASSSVTALARRFDDRAWQDLQDAAARVTGRALRLAAPAVRSRLTSGPPTIDLDATDIEVYGRKKREVTYNYLGQRSGRVHAASWAEAGLVSAVRLTDSRTTAYTHAVDLVEQSLAWLEQAGLQWNPQQRPRVRADIGFCSKDIAEGIVAAGADFAIGIQRQQRIWRLLHLIDPSDWQPALDMDRAEVAVLNYHYRGWPRGTRLIVRRVRHQVHAIGDDVRARRHRTLPPGQLALALEAGLEQIYGYSFILTNLDISTPQRAAQIEHWHRHRTDIEELFKQAKHGAALRHLPSGDPAVNRAWVHTAFLAVALTAWLNLVLEQATRVGIVRWRRELINQPARLVRHARQAVLRCATTSPLSEVLARIRELPTAS